MIKTKMYRYLGRNGIITSPILLENSSPIIMFDLKADENKILTNGIKETYNTIVFEDELKDWYEIEKIKDNIN